VPVDTSSSAADSTGGGGGGDSKTEIDSGSTIKGESQVVGEAATDTDLQEEDNIITSEAAGISVELISFAINSNG
jgi:hypothetical protein